MKPAESLRKCEGCGWRYHDYEIQYKVCERYPITDAERRCKRERQRMDGIRDEYKKRLIEQEANSKQEYDHQPEV